MRFDVVTLFPELFTPFLQTGVTRRAYEQKHVDVRLVNPRDFADGNYRRVDDRPFGGGPGMVMMAEPLSRCVEHLFTDRETERETARETELFTPGAVVVRPKVVLFSPIGQRLNHAMVQRWSDDAAGAILICGRYEGVDQRFIDHYVDEQLSLGDFVLSGGEIAAMALLDALARLMPGVLGDSQSHVQDSFNPALGGLLDCPHYTRPEQWALPNGSTRGVPPELLSGNHAGIDAWRQAQRLALTQKHRPDLL